MDSFKFKTNIPETVKFKFAKPKTGKSEYGDWWLHGVTRNGKDDSFFATGLLQSTLVHAGIQKDTTATITQKQREGVKGVYWQVEIDGNIYTSDDLANAKDAVATQKKEEQNNHKPTINQLCNRYLEIWDAVTDELDSRGLPIDLRREVVTSIFIQAQRENIPFEAK